MKLTDAQKSHLPPTVARDIELDAPVYNFVTARLVHGVLKLTDEDGDSHYFYRGRDILRDGRVPNGYGGSWRVNGYGRNSLGFDSLKGCKAHIDALVR